MLQVGSRLYGVGKKPVFRIMQQLDQIKRSELYAVTNRIVCAVQRHHEQSRLTGYTSRKIAYINRTPVDVWEALNLRKLSILCITESDAMT